MERNATKQHTWEGSGEEDERQMYLTMWRLLNDNGILAAILAVVRVEASPQFPTLINGNVSFNYFLRRMHLNPVPSNDLDIKIEVGELARYLIPAELPDQGLKLSDDGSGKECLGRYIDHANGLLVNNNV